ncbi:MAG: MFS transporter, partial [Candidatus Nezhaarchaeales archaeon]
ALSIPVGRLMDKVGKKMPLAIACVLLAASMWLFADGGASLVVVSLVLMGAGSVTIHTGLGSLIADLVPMRDRGKVNAFLNFSSLSFMALGNLVGGILYERLSPRLPFYLAALIGLSAALLVAFFVKEAEGVRDYIEHDDL